MSIASQVSQYVFEVPEQDDEVILSDYPVCQLLLKNKAHKLINALLEEIFQSIPEHWDDSWLDENQQNLTALKTIFKSDLELQCTIVHAAFVHHVWLRDNLFKNLNPQPNKDECIQFMQRYRITTTIFPWFLKKILSIEIPYKDSDLVNLVEIHIACKLKIFGVKENRDCIRKAILEHIDKYIKEFGLSQYLRVSLEKLKQYHQILQKDELDKIYRFLSINSLEFGDVWADTALNDLAEMNSFMQSSWESLISHSLTASASEPSLKWLGKASKFLSIVEQPKFKESLLRWFPAFDQPASIPNQTLGHNNYVLMPASDRNCTILKGFVWCCSLFEDEEIIQAIATLAEDSFKKIPLFGPRSLKVGNACLYTLSVMPGKLAIAHLERLRQKCKNGSVKKQIEKAFDRAAQRAGLSREDLAEVMLPTYELTPQGITTHTFGDFTAEIRIHSTHSVTLNWLKADGKPQKSVPAAVKKDHAPTLKTLKRTVDDIQKLLTAQRDRLESLYLNPRTWNFATWQERYLQHPLLCQLAQRLIWQFEHEGSVMLGIWQNGQLVDEGDRPLTPFTDNTQVTLWHPIYSTPETVLTWRTWLETHQIVQPFKQAHREVYLLTDAELATGTYSNRFAAHILRQHQFAALAHQTGWRYQLQGFHFDGYNIPIRELPQWNLQITYWVDIAGEALSQAGISLYLATDQVRFCDPMGTPQSLETVPAIAFTEVMRNIDLFVGVASIGNDPSWQDQGAQPHYNAYWESYSFGELNTSAQIRREVLSRLLPKLKIGDRCSLSEKFLVVQGTLRTYNIHLGSGNILMEPNSQYLCIVPDHPKNTTESIFLPFEGDTTLSVILSKAFLLANDAKIQDPTILSQIKRK
jgi:hypothetical protein